MKILLITVYAHFKQSNCLSADDSRLNIINKKSLGQCMTVVKFPQSLNQNAQKKPTTTGSVIMDSK